MALREPEPAAPPSPARCHATGRIGTWTTRKTMRLTRGRKMTQSRHWKEHNSAADCLISVKFCMGKQFLFLRISEMEQLPAFHRTYFSVFIFWPENIQPCFVSSVIAQSLISAATSQSFVDKLVTAYVACWRNKLNVMYECKVTTIGLLISTT